MSGQEKEHLVISIITAVNQYQRESLRGWRESPQRFFTLLPALRPDVLRAYSNVLTTYYLEPLLVERIILFNDWTSILTLNAHLDWLHAHPAEAQHLLNRSKELSDRLGIKVYGNGWHPTLEAHLRAEEEYQRTSRCKDHEDVSYMENRKVQDLVESHAENVEKLCQYMNARQWRSFDNENFKESLEQNALGAGCL